MCESDKPHPYPMGSSTYRNEQVRADEVQRVIMYNSYTPCPWLHQNDSCIIATNMAYYCLPQWNPVWRKVVLSKPRRNNGGEGVQLHSFLTLAIKWRSVVTSTPWPLYPQGPTTRLDIQWREKSQVSTGVQKPYLEACSIITIAHYFTQTARWTKTCNQHSLQSPVCICAVYSCCSANSPRWYMELLLLNLFVLWTISQTFCICSSNLY
jgi:hypothetical protein